MMDENPKRQELEDKPCHRDPLFRVAFDSSPHSTVITDLEGNILACNQQFVRLHQMTEGPEHQVGKNVEEFFPEDQRPRLRESIVELLKERKSKGSVIFTILRGDGEASEVETWSTLIFDDKGEPSGILSYALDVSGRLDAERALRRSEEQYRTLAEAAEDSIYLVNTDGILSYVNPSGAKLLGREVQDIIGSTLADHFDVEDAKSQLEAVRLVARNGESLHVERPVTFPTGKRWLSTQLVHVPGETGKEGAALGISRDITERKHAETAMLRASRLEATATLAGGVAHDFNNLMVGVLGNAELLRDDFGDRAEAVEMLEIISSSARRAGQLAQQLLAFARGGKYSPEALSFNDIIQETLSIQDRSFPPRVRIERDIEAELWLVDADKTQLTQVLMNLCINAVEAIEGNGRIVISTRNMEIDESYALTRAGLEVGAYVYFGVEDTGSGMDAETRARVFEPFFSTKNRGRGLGLAAVYGIIKNHGGYISVYSEVDKGTAFKIYLPVKDARTESKISKQPLDHSRARTVMLIDDEEIVIEVTQKMLERLGYRVLTASNGLEAVELATSYDGDIHLALLDMGMPVMGGLEAYPKLMDARPELKVVVCSGYELDRSAQMLLDAGAVAFLQKPFRAKDLSQIITTAFDASLQD